MSNIEIKIDSKELEKLNSKINSVVTGKYTHIAKVMKDITFGVEQATKLRFNTSEAPNGSKWVAVSEKTKRAYQKNNRWFGSTLFRTGFMRNAISSESFTYTGRVFLSHVAANRHQFGGKGIPAREYMGIGKKENAAIDRVLKYWSKQWQ